MLGRLLLAERAMERGVLINGGREPRQIEVVFESLIAEGTLSRVQPEKGRRDIIEC